MFPAKHWKTDEQADATRGKKTQTNKWPGQTTDTPKAWKERVGSEIWGGNEAFEKFLWVLENSESHKNTQSKAHAQEKKNKIKNT